MPETSERIAELRRELESHPASRQFYQLGELLRREGRAAEAMSVLRAGMAHHPRYVAAWVSLARACLDRALPADAAVALHEAIELDAHNPVAWRLLGEARLASGDRFGALDAMQHALQLAPGDEVLRAAVDALGSETWPPDAVAAGMAPVVASVMAPSTPGEAEPSVVEPVAGPPAAEEAMRPEPIVVEGAGPESVGVEPVSANAPATTPVAAVPFPLAPAVEDTATAVAAPLPVADEPFAAASAAVEVTAPPAVPAGVSTHAGRPRSAPALSSEPLDEPFADLLPPQLAAAPPAPRIDGALEDPFAVEVPAAVPAFADVFALPAAPPAIGDGPFELAAPLASPALLAEAPAAPAVDALAAAGAVPTPALQEAPEPAPLPAAEVAWVSRIGVDATAAGGAAGDAAFAATGGAEAAAAEDVTAVATPELSLPPSPDAVDALARAEGGAAPLAPPPVAGREQPPAAEPPLVEAGAEEWASSAPAPEPAATVVPLVEAFEAMAAPEAAVAPMAAVLDELVIPPPTDFSSTSAFAASPLDTPTRDVIAAIEAEPPQVEVEPVPAGVAAAPLAAVAVPAAEERSADAIAAPVVQAAPPAEPPTAAAPSRPTLTLARLHLQQQDFPSAIAILERVVVADPDNQEARDLLDLVHDMMAPLPGELPSLSARERKIAALQGWLASLTLGQERMAR